MSEEFGIRYQAFINACFLPYTAVGHDARLKASEQRQRTERGGRWAEPVKSNETVSLRIY